MSIESYKEAGGCDSGSCWLNRRVLYSLSTMNSSGWKYSGAAAQRSGAKEQRAEGKKGAAKFAAGNEVDNGVLDALENILKDMAAQGDSRDYQAMVQFFRKGFGSQVVQTWSYYVQTNNHAKTSHSTSLVARTLTVLRDTPTPCSSAPRSSSSF